MTHYVPASSMGWLDFDPVASERVATMLRALDEPGTLDVLGLGTIRDLFSDRLTPGTSTIQTRLRYFLFVPWIFQELHRRSGGSGGPFDRLRDLEVRLIECLAHLGPNQGVIGFNARRNLKRMPSETYWGGLGTWGVRRFDLSIRDYLQHSDRDARRVAQRDDDGNVTDHPTALWSSVPGPPDGFLDGPVTFDLDSDEAAFLIDHVRRRHPDSIVACYAGTDVGTTPLPWQLPRDRATPTLLDWMGHARNFAELTLGAQLVYNVLLARTASRELGWDTSELEADQRNRLDEWASMLNGRSDELRAWVDDLDGFWGFLGDGVVQEPTRRFVAAMVRRSVDDPVGFVDDPDVAGGIRDREAQLKKRRARLTNRSALENWNGAPFGGLFDYRWGTTVSYLRDLRAAIEGSG